MSFRLRLMALLNLPDEPEVEALKIFVMDRQLERGNRRAPGAVEINRSSIVVGTPPAEETRSRLEEIQALIQADDFDIDSIDELL